LKREKLRKTIDNKKWPWAGACLCLALFIILVPGFAAGAKISAVVDHNRITPDETIHLTVTIDGGKGKIDTSAIRDFTVVSRGTGSSIQMINGKTTRQTIANFILIPLKVGPLTIPPLSVKTGGEVLKTREIKIIVARSPAQNTESKELFVQGTVSNKAPYAGEQIIYTFTLVSAVRMANLRFQKPAFQGFTARQIGDSRTRQRVVNGRSFDVTELDYLLVPIASGPLTIDSALLGCDVIQPNKRSGSSFDSFFNDSFFGNVNSKPVVLKTRPIALTVKSLPENTGGDSFSGLVGQFRMTAELKEATLKTGDSTTLAVTITGRGNIMDAESPAIDVPQGLKKYQDTPEEAIELDPKGYSGRKTFRSALVAVTPGIYTLSSSKMVFFDPEKGLYRPLHAGPFELTVNPSGETPDAPVYAPPVPDTVAKIKKQKVMFTGHDILPLKEGLDALKSRKKITLKLFIFYLLMPALVYLILRIGRNVMRKDVTHRIRMLKKSEKALKKAGKTGISGKTRLDLLYRALVAAIFASADRSGEAITYQEARDILQQKGYSDEVVSQSVALLEKIESARYGGMHLDENVEKDLLTLTGQLVKRSLS
jgi:hypothetical protein